MNTSMIKGTIIGGLATVAIAAAGVGGFKVLSQPKYADVVAVKEVTETITTPREECRNVAVQQQVPARDPARITGTVIGGIAGGVLGSQIGRGPGNTVATIAGAAGGAYVGNQLQGGMQKNDVVTATKRQCKTVYDRSEMVIGYDVTYRLKDKEGVVRTTYMPGPTLPVVKGQVVATQPVASPSCRNGTC